MSRVASWLVVLAVAIAVASQTLLPPQVGAADNGDFTKVTGWLSLANPLGDAHVLRFADLNFSFDAKFHYLSGFYSSEVLLAGVAIGLNRFVSQAGNFDIRVMGLVHTAVFLVTWWLLLPLVQGLPRARRYVLLGLAAAMFTDVMYVEYFNSFFMDAASLLFLLLAVVAYLRATRWQRATDRWILVLAVAMLVTSKTQHFLLALPFAALMAWKGHLLTPGFGRKFRTRAVVVILAAGAFSARSAPSNYPAFGQYTAVFFQILPKTPDVDQALADLGLEESDRQYVGTQAYGVDAGLRDPEFTARFQREFSYGTLGRFFLTHPFDALRSIEDRLAEAGAQRSVRGNFPSTAGLPEFAKSERFALWSGFKARVFENHGRVYLIYALLLALGVPLAAMRWKHRLPQGTAEGAAALALMLVIEMTITGLADGLDAARHLLVFAALTDILLLAGIGIGLAAGLPGDTRVE
jgi:hypothetical protein